MFWVNTSFATACSRLPSLCVFRQIKPFTEHQYGIIKRPLCIVLYGLRTTLLSLSISIALTVSTFHTHTHWFGVCFLVRAGVWALRGLLYDDSGWDLLIPSPAGPCNPPFVTLGKSAKSKCGVSPVCVFNVPLLLSPMTRGGPPRVLALSPGVLSLLYLSTGHGRSPKDNHTCMLKEGPLFFIHLNTRRENQTSQIVPLQQLLYSWLHYRPFFFPHPSHLNLYIYNNAPSSHEAGRSSFVFKDLHLKKTLYKHLILNFKIDQKRRISHFHRVFQTATNLCRTLTCISFFNSKKNKKKNNFFNAEVLTGKQ